MLFQGEDKKADKDSANKMRTLSRVCTVFICCDNVCIFRQLLLSLVLLWSVNQKLNLPFGLNGRAYIYMHIIFIERSFYSFYTCCKTLHLSVFNKAFLNYLLTGQKRIRSTGWLWTALVITTVCHKEQCCLQLGFEWTKWLIERRPVLKEFETRGTETEKAHSASSKLSVCVC